MKVKPDVVAEFVTTALFAIVAVLLVWLGSHLVGLPLTAVQAAGAYILWNTLVVTARVMILGARR